MYTEDSPQQVTSLNEERADPPAIIPGDDPQSRSISHDREWWAAWLEVVKAVLMWVASFTLLVTVPVVTALPYVFYRLFSVGASAAQTLASDKMLLLFSVLGILPAHLLTLAVIWLVISEGGRRPFWKSIHLEWPKSWGPATTVIGCVMLALALFGFAQLVGYIYGEKKTDLDLLIESSIYARLATAFMATATAPLVEEIIYRGVLYQSLEKAAGAAVAVPIVSLMFAGVHVWQYRNNIAVILVITLLSIVLTLVRALSGTVLPAFLIHLVFNGIQSFFIVASGFVENNPAK